MKLSGFMKTLVIILKLSALGLLIGVLGGFSGGVFAHLLSFVTMLRESFPWLIVLLPIGGIATVFLYRIFGMEKHGGTNEIIRSLENNGKIRTIAAPLIFVSTAITHLFGGSAGREGAAIQLGGAGAAALSKVLKLDETEQNIFIRCGMSAVFAGVFGTPLTAAFFILEFKTKRKIMSMAILPCFISAFASKMVSSFMGVAEERVKLSNITPFSVDSFGKIFVLAIGISLLSFVMCFVFEKSKVWANKFISNSYFRIIIGAVVVVALTACVGDMRYNGSGMSMAISAIEGKTDWFDFILKIIFTAVTISAGFKGGEIVPTFCIGATFGCMLGGVLGLDASLAAALGLVGLFCLATKSLFGAVFLGVEMFGFSVLPYFIIICLILWPISPNNGLFENRLFESPILMIKNKKAE